MVKCFPLTQWYYQRDGNVCFSESSEFASSPQCLQYFNHNMGKIPFMMSNLKCGEPVQTQFKWVLSQDKSCRIFKKKITLLSCICSSSFWILETTIKRIVCLVPRNYHQHTYLCPTSVRILLIVLEYDCFFLGCWYCMASMAIRYCFTLLGIFVWNTPYERCLCSFYLKRLGWWLTRSITICCNCHTANI